MKQVLILERCTSGLDRVNESARGRDYVMGGTFTEFNKLNRNNRIYTAEKFIPHLNELAGRINDFGVVYGEYDHPEGFEIQLKNASHIINSVKYLAEEQRVHGEIKLLTTKFGKEARSLVDDGCPVFVSSRAAGVTESNGHVQVRRLFTYDIVADPGFSAAKMNMKNMNESFGLADEDTIRIYDMTNESTTNDLFNMNGNDNVTRTMMREYGDHLMGHVSKLEEQLMQYIKEGRDASEIERTAELIDNTQANITKVQEYLDYLSTELVAQVQKNNDLDAVIESLTSQNNETIAKLDKAVAYIEHVAERVDNTISFVEHVAENVKSNVELTESVSADVKSVTEFTEYVAEHVKSEKGVTAALTERVDYSKQIYDNLSETMNGAIAFTEYLAGHVKNSVEYVEYVVESVEENAEYAEYLAKNLDGLIEHNENMTETLNAAFAAKGLNEAVISIESPVTSLGLDNDSAEETEETEETEEGGDATTGDQVTSADIDKPAAEPEVTGIAGDEGASSDSVNSVEDSSKEGEAAAQPAQGDEAAQPADGEAQPAQPEATVEPAQGETPAQPVAADDTVATDTGATADVPVNAVEAEEVPETPTASAATRIELDGDEIHITKNGQETVIKLGGGETPVAESITDKISTLIAEAKKRKAAENNEPHFFKFLTESQVVDFKALTEEQQEQVKVAMNESEYFSGHDVLRVIHKTLAAAEPTLNERLVANIPADVQENWTSLNESQQASVLATSRFYAGDLTNPRQIENFWRTRPLAASLNEGKVVLNETRKDDDSFAEDEINRFINRFKSI